MYARRLTPSMSSLLAFEASARHTSFTKAGAELALTQSAVSRQVHLLEEQLQVVLFRREGKLIQLTAAGDIYYREIRSALQHIRSASLQVLSLSSGGGSLHLASLPTFASKWLMPRLNDFYSACPGVLVHMHSRIGQFDMEQAGIDATISVGDGTWPGAAATRLMDERLVPIISPAILREQDVTKPQDLARNVLLFVASRLDAWRQWFHKYDLPINTMRSGPQFELTSHLIQAVAAGLGVGLVPSFLIEDELRSGVVRLALDAPLQSGVAYYLFVPQYKTEMPTVKAFRDWLLLERAISQVSAASGK